MGSDPRRATPSHYQGQAGEGSRSKGAAERCGRRGPGGLCSPAASACGAGAGAAPPLFLPRPAAPPAPTNRPPTAPLPAQASPIEAPRPPPAGSARPRPAARPGCCLGSRWQCGEPVCPPGSHSTPYFINIPFSSIPAPRSLPGHAPRLAPAPEKSQLLPPRPCCRHSRPSASGRAHSRCAYRIPGLGCGALPGARPSPPGPAGSLRRRARTARGWRRTERARSGTAAARSELPRAPRTGALGRETGAGPAAGREPASRPLAAPRRRGVKGPRAASRGRGQQGAQPAGGAAAAGPGGARGAAT